jgi:choline dehydrogenase-like flavoprotein
MFIDACTLPEGEHITTAVCIIGAGPAGNTLAKELLKSNVSVCVLESGNFEQDDSTQRLYDHALTGDPFKLTGTRLRQFGGTSNLWNIQLRHDLIGVRHAVLDAIDFEARDWIPHSGWPFGKSELDPFYVRAQIMCKAGPYAYHDNSWADERMPAFALDAQKVTTRVFQFGPKSAFSADLKQEFERSPFLRIYLNANVTGLHTTGTGTAVSMARAATLNGNTFSVSARVFVIAAGGIESARLLLVSNSFWKKGIGNAYDQLGKFFMDHPLLYGGHLTPSHPQLFGQADLYDLRQAGGTYVMGRLGLSEAALRDNKLLNISALLFPRVSEAWAKVQAGIMLSASNARAAAITRDSAKIVFAAVKAYGVHGAWPYLYREDLPDFPLDKGGWSSLTGTERLRFSGFDVLHQTEQAPNPNNRITLLPEKDALGMQKIALHWKWNTIDQESIGRAQQILKTEFARSGIGHFEIAQINGAPRIIYPGTHHHMGTTRMHINPKLGVVDGDCRVHGVENLFVASSSVFPTGGFANPTLTIVALAIRLADHLKDNLVAKKF